MMKDILNCGVVPADVIDLLKTRFLESGGLLLEGVTFQKAYMYVDVAHVHVSKAQAPKKEAGGAGGKGTLSAYQFRFSEAYDVGT